MSLWSPTFAKSWAWCLCGKIKDYGKKKNYWNSGCAGESEKGTGCGTTVHSLLRWNTSFYALAGVQKRNAGDRGFRGMGWILLDDGTGVLVVVWRSLVVEGLLDKLVNTIQNARRNLFCSAPGFCIFADEDKSSATWTTWGSSTLCIQFVRHLTN